MAQTMDQNPSSEGLTEEDIIYTIDLLGDAVDATQEVPYPTNIAADVIGGAIFEHVGRELELPEGIGAKIGALLAEEFTEDNLYSKE